MTHMNNKTMILMEEKKRQAITEAHLFIPRIFTPKILLFLTLFSVLFTILFTVSSQDASAFPPIASEFYGTAYIDGKPAGINTTITVFTAQDIRCGQFTIKEAGTYGFLSCLGDDPDTIKVEGATHGESILFFVDNKPARAQGNAQWGEGSFHQVNITLETGQK